MTSVRTPPPLGSIGVTATYGNKFDKFVGRSIRWFTATQNSYGKFVDSPVNHAVVYVGRVAGKGLPQLVQAAPGGANFANWDSYGNDMIWLDPVDQLQADGALKSLEITDQQRMKIAAFAKDCAVKQIGYNYLDFLAIALAQKRFQVSPGEETWLRDEWWVKRLSNNKRLICSQLVDYCYSRAGIQLFADNRPNGLVSPADLYSLGSYGS